MTGTAWNVGTYPTGRQVHRDEARGRPWPLGFSPIRNRGTPGASTHELPRGSTRRLRSRREHVWIDKATGVEYLAVGSDPLAAPNPRSTEVAAFLIDEYKDIVFLRSLV
jgi:hypothetical protein